MRGDVDYYVKQLPNDATRLGLPNSITHGVYESDAGLSRLVALCRDDVGDVIRRALVMEDRNEARREARRRMRATR